MEIWQSVRRKRAVLTIGAKDAWKRVRVFPTPISAIAIAHPGCGRHWFAMRIGWLEERDGRHRLRNLPARWTFAAGWGKFEAMAVGTGRATKMPWRGGG